jgi:hypothetical protein
MEIIVVIKSHSGVNELPVCFPVMDKEKTYEVVGKANDFLIKKIKEIAKDCDMSYEEMIKGQEVYENESIGAFEDDVLDTGFFDYDDFSVSLSWAEVK